MKEIEIELKVPENPIFYEMTNSTNQLDSSLSDDPSKEDLVINNPSKQSSIQKHDPRPPSAPQSEANRHHHRRRHHHHQQSHEQNQEIISQPHKPAESDLDGEPMDPNASFRRKSLFKSLKLKKDKIPLPRPSSASGNEQLDERQAGKNARIPSGTLRPSRVNHFCPLNALSTVIFVLSSCSHFSIYSWETMLHQ